LEFQFCYHRHLLDIAKSPIDSPGILFNGINLLSK
jgi:hypothetical protein